LYVEAVGIRLEQKLFRRVDWIVQMKKRKLVFLIFFVLLMLVCAAPFCLLLGIPQEWRTRQGLAVMEGAEYLFEDLSLYGGSTSLRSLYYWIDAPTDEVQNYYERFTTGLIQSGDEYGTWAIGLMGQDNTQPTPNDHTYSIHGSLCSYRDRYDCVSVALVDVSQPKFYRLAVSSGTQFRRSEPPPAFATLPGHGTLIIYSYYVPDY